MEVKEQGGGGGKTSSAAFRKQVAASIRLVAVISAVVVAVPAVAVDTAQSSQPFTPAFNLALSNSTPSANGTIYTSASVPAGQHALATWSLLAPTSWSIGVATNGEAVGRGTMAVDIDCNGSIESFGPFALTGVPADPESVAEWRAVITSWWSMTFTAENTGAGYDIGASMIDITQAHTFCGPETFTLTLFGQSEPGDTAVLTNPVSPGDYQWTGSFVSMGGDHTANVSNSMCVGSTCPGPTVGASVQVKPDWPVNYIDLDRPSVVPAAVLTNETLNAASISPLSITLEDAQASHWGARDVDGDGDQDMVFHFPAAEMTVDTGQTQACAQGVMLDGTTFSGCDGLQVIAPGADSDGDSLGVGTPPALTDDVEASLGTDPFSACGGSNAWPPDLTGEGVVNITDILRLKTPVGAQLGSPGYFPRLDLVFDGSLNISDVLSLRSFFGLTCTVAESDADGDTVPHSSDPDDDNDGFSDSVEEFMVTSPLRDCAATSTADDEPVDSFPPDFDDTRAINISDVLALKPVFGIAAAYQRRYDLNASGTVNISDVLAVKPYFGTSCT